MATLFYTLKSHLFKSCFNFALPLCSPARMCRSVGAYVNKHQGVVL